MKYEKPSIEVIRFENNVAFLAVSPGCPINYSSATEALQDTCIGFQGNVNSFTCTSFGGYSGTDVPKGATVTVAGATYTYVFSTHGNSGHWYCSSNNP